VLKFKSTLRLVVLLSAWSCAQPAVYAQAQTELETAKAFIRDYPQLARYAAENRQVPPPRPDEQRVVFLGDSITDFWGRQTGVFFPGKPYINRGIGAQVTPQMLIRFRPDVVDLQPEVVIILAGTNDIGGRYGPIPTHATEENLMSMAELAKVHNIAVVFSSLLPVCDCHGQTQTVKRPRAQILALNDWIKSYASTRSIVYLDYYSKMLDANGNLRQDLTDDGLHPNAAGYKVMTPLAEAAIKTALKLRK
jgi:lysophospholipase L1-like esterase